MKKVVIFIVVLFLGIFAARWYFSFVEKQRTEKAKIAYEDFIKKREAKGDVLKMDQFMKQLASSELPVALTANASDKDKEFIKRYLEGDKALVKKYLFGHPFIDLRRIEARKLWRQDVADPAFNPRVNRFGPSRFTNWAHVANPPIVPAPTQKYVASRVLRKLSKLVDLVDNIGWSIDTVIPKDEFAEDGLFGLHLLRDLEPEAKKEQLAKLLDYQKASSLLGRLQIRKGGRSAPFRMAENMLELSDLIAKEAILKDEIKLSHELDKVLKSYLEYLLAYQKPSDRFVRFQKQLMKSNLDIAIFNALRSKRIASTSELKKSLETLTITKVDAISIFDSGLLMSPYQQWRLLMTYSEAGIMLIYDETGKEKTEFNMNDLRKAAAHIKAVEEELDLTIEGRIAFSDIMRDLEGSIYTVMEKQLLRHRFVMELAVANFRHRTGSYPLSEKDLTLEDLPEVPLHPITNKPYEFKAEFTKDGKLKDIPPNLKFNLNPKYLIEKVKKDSFKN